MLPTKTPPMPKTQKPSWLSISTISASSGFSSQTMCAAIRPRLASESASAILPGGNWLMNAGSHTPPEWLHECSGQSRIAPVRKSPAQSIASIIAFESGIGRGPSIPTRSIDSVVGVSHHASKASRMNSFRLPDVVGSQFRRAFRPADVQFEAAVVVGPQLVAEDVRLRYVAEGLVQRRPVGARDLLRPGALHRHVEPSRGAPLAGDLVGVVAVDPGLPIREVRNVSAQLAGWRAQRVNLRKRRILCLQGQGRRPGPGSVSGTEKRPHACIGAPGLASLNTLSPASLSWSQNHSRPRAATRRRARRQRPSSGSQRGENVR